MKEQINQQMLNIAHEIQQLFRYTYKEQWVSQIFINKHERLWIKVFNDLVNEGFIEKKKSHASYQYRWKAKHPEL